MAATDNEESRISLPRGATAYCIERCAAVALERKMKNFIGNTAAKPLFLIGGPISVCRRLLEVSVVEIQVSS